jgi:hypothetical protein
MHGLIGLMFLAAYMVSVDEYLLVISMIWIAAGTVVEELKEK